jgi:hypothetical protein
MSNWRDRSERDATIPRDVKHIKINERKNLNKYKKEPPVIPVFSLLIAIFSMVIAIVSLLQNVKIFGGGSKSYNPSISKLVANQYVCNKNKSGRLETLIVNSRNEKRVFISWNDSFSSARCERITDRLNSDKRLEYERYIVYESTADFTRLCIVKNSYSSCSKETVENIIYDTDTSDRENNSQFIYSLNIDHCRIYPSIKIEGSSGFKSSSQICFSPLQE